MKLNKTTDPNHQWVRYISGSGEEHFALMCSKTGAQFTYLLKGTPAIMCCCTVETWAPKWEWLAKFTMPVKRFRFSVRRSSVTSIPYRWDGTVTFESGAE